MQARKRAGGVNGQEERERGSDLTSLFINQVVLVEQRAAIWNE